MLELQGPSVLAQLPRQLTEGKISFGSVYGLRVAEKVKRYEIVAAVDGEAINTYNIQSSKLIASYSVPPQSTFACAPCSIRSKVDGRSSAVRHIYCVIQRKDTQLHCFKEQDEAIGNGRTPSTMFALTGTQSPVIFLETVPLSQSRNKGASSWDVLVLHQDGTVRMVSGDLSTERWTMNITHTMREPECEILVTAAHWISGEQARSSLLKRRPDIMTHGGGESPSFLVVIAKKVDSSTKEVLDMVYGLWHLTNQLSYGTLSTQPMQRDVPLLLHSLPRNKTWRKDNAAQYTLNPISGWLSIAHTGGLATYDLSTLTPVLISKLSSNTSDTTEALSSMRLSSSIAATATPSTVTLHDTKHLSVQSVLDLDKAHSRRKRKRSSSDPLRLIAYFPKTQRLVACRGHVLLAIDVSNVGQNSGHNALSGGSLMIDAIGHAISPSSMQNTKTPGVSLLDFGTFRMPALISTGEWSSQQQRLNELAKPRTIAEFEQTMANVLCDSLPPGELSESGGVQLPRSALYVDPSKIDYLISKIFLPTSRAEQGSEGPGNFDQGLKIALKASRLTKWLSSVGLLVASRIEQALIGSGTTKSLRLSSDAIALALTQEDPACEMIVDYLQRSPYLTGSEVLQTIKLLLADVVAAVQDIRRPSPMELDDGSHDVAMTENANLGSKSQNSESGKKLALSVVQPLRDDASLDRSSIALLTALDICGMLSSQTITNEMRSLLSQSEVLSIIQLLRQQLFHSGHTSYLPTPPASATSSPNPGASGYGNAFLSLEIILKLLSSCIDAFGALGFLAQSESDDFLAKLIPDLKSEISFAFEGMQETNHLQGLLREVIRFADSAENEQNAVLSGTPAKPALMGEQKPGTIVTLHREARADRGDAESTGELLPLSLRGDDVVSPTKVRKGGGQIRKRSKRDIMRLQSRNVGVYQFERLVL